jgi:hypothetical protein
MSLTRADENVDTAAGAGRTAPSGPQLGRPKPTNAGGPSPFVLFAVAFATGVAIAKWIDWRGHAHPKH